MTVRDLINNINLQCDESYSITAVLAFLNNGISYINANLPANFPPILLADIDTPYTALREDIQRTILYYYACYQLKLNDGDVLMAREFKGNADDSFANMRSNYKVPDEYKAENNNVVIPTDVYIYKGSW